MNEHTEDGRLLAYLDGELPPDGRAALAGHLAQCLPCRQALERARDRAGVVSAALRTLDGPVPMQSAWRAIEASLDDVSRARAAGPSRRAWPLARAAGLVLLLAGGAAAAVVPGSPVREWLAQRAEPEAATVAAPAALEPSVRALPLDGAITIDLSAPAGASVEVRWGGEGARVSGPAVVRFGSADGRLDAVAEGGPVRVQLPAGIRSATLVLNGREVLAIRDGAVRSVPDDARGSLVPDGAEPLVFTVEG